MLYHTGTISLLKHVFKIIIMVNSLCGERSWPSGRGFNPHTQCLSQDLDFFKKRSYCNFLGSYLQKRGVILSTAKMWQMYIKYAYYMPEHVAII